MSVLLALGLVPALMAKLSERRARKVRQPNLPEKAQLV